MEHTSSFLVVEPVVPTYCISDVNVAKVVKFLFAENRNNLERYVIQYVSSLCENLSSSERNVLLFTTLPLHSDTVVDEAVYTLFKAVKFNREDTLYEFKAWGITKVYLAPFYDKVISMEDFIDGVQKHFVGKGKEYAPASSDEKMVIFQ